LNSSRMNIYISHGVLIIIEGLLRCKDVHKSEPRHNSVTKNNLEVLEWHFLTKIVPVRKLCHHLRSILLHNHQKYYCPHKKIQKSASFFFNCQSWIPYGHPHHANTTMSRADNSSTKNKSSWTSHHHHHHTQHRKHPRRTVLLILVKLSTQPQC
jgi:hypothetical protein